MDNKIIYPIPLTKRCFCSIIPQPYNIIYVNRYPKIQKKGFCRGCGHPIPSYRYTWCCYDCYKRFCPAEVFREVDKRDKRKCVICGSSNKIEYDHIKPFSEGGLTIIENIRTLCINCHKKRTLNWRKFGI